MHLPSRLARELRTITAMMEIYCADHHSPEKSLCDDCTEILIYARKRLSLCPYKSEKPTCGNCTIHCYKKNIQERVKEIMRYSGPRMIWKHPVMAFQHLLDSRRKNSPHETCCQTEKNQQTKL